MIWFNRMSTRGFNHIVAVVFYPKRPRMILSSACVSVGKRVRSSLWRFASKAGQWSNKFSYDSSALSYRRNIVSANRLIRFLERRSAGQWPLRKRRRSVVWDLDSKTSSY